MGPVILLDKSALQGLANKESVILSRHFYQNIPPVLLIEILADIKKKKIPLEKREKEVQTLSTKLKKFNQKINLNYIEMLERALFDIPLPMEGKIIIPGETGKYIQLPNGEKGIFYDETPEAKAWGRWQRGEFLEGEKDLAGRWRDHIDGFDLEKDARMWRKLLGVVKLEDLKSCYDFANEMFQVTGQGYNILCTILNAFHIPRAKQKLIIQRWKQKGYPEPLQVFPYPAYCFRILLFFHLALASNLVTTRKNTKIDLEYLFYLPFTQIFSSSDKFHHQFVPFFIRGDQSFIDGNSLKFALAALVKEKEAGKQINPQVPPIIEGCPIGDLWEKHYDPLWREKAKTPPKIMTEEEKQKILKEVKPFFDAWDREKEKSGGSDET